MAAPDFLAIGHVSRDVTPEGHALGGAVVFGAVTAARMGLRPAIVTSAAPDFDPGPALAGIPVHVVPAGATTSFDNVDADGARTQYLHAVAGPIGPSDVPEDWRAAAMVLLAPLARELGGDALRFPGATVVAALQGWLRRWDDTGLVGPRRWDGAEVLPHVDAAVVSEHDFGDADVASRWAALAPALVVTRGARGAVLHHGGAVRDVPAFAAREVDPVGAGDVFAAAYLVAYHESGDPVYAATWASCAASFAVEAPGVAGIPTRAQVAARLESQGCGCSALKGFPRSCR